MHFQTAGARNRLSLNIEGALASLVVNKRLNPSLPIMCTGIGGVQPLYTRTFRALLTNAGVKPVRLPPQSPNLNAYAELFVPSIKSECLDRMVFLGEGHLRRAIRSYVEHYHLERSHQGLGNRLIEGPSQPASGRAARQERLGGLLNPYSREAA